jgi:diacylglycerol kinase family enzyme
MLCRTSRRWKYLAYIPMLLMGQLRRAREISFVRASEVRCEAIGADPVWVQVDGEAAGRLPAEFRIVPDALTVAVPNQPST